MTKRIVIKIKGDKPSEDFYRGMYVDDDTGEIIREVERETEYEAKRDLLELHELVYVD